MRIAVLVIGLVLTFGLFIQAFVIFGLSDIADDEDTGAAGAIGILSVRGKPRPFDAPTTAGNAGAVAVSKG